VTSSILIGGEFVADSGYDRGPMILYPEEEWRRRKDLLRKDHIRFRRINIAFSLTMPALILFGLIFVPKAREDPFIIGLLVLSSGMVAMLIGFSRMNTGEFDRYHLMGLYEKGFEYYEKFLPYVEIERIALENKQLKLWLIHGPRESPLIVGTEKRAMTLLGHDGIEEISKRVRGHTSPKTVH
jgi:hypothetical protein